MNQLHFARPLQLRASFIQSRRASLLACEAPQRFWLCCNYQSGLQLPCDFDVTRKLFVGTSVFTRLPFNQNKAERPAGAEGRGIEREAIKLMKCILADVARCLVKHQACAAHCSGGENSSNPSWFRLERRHWHRGSVFVSVRCCVSDGRFAYLWFRVVA